MFETLKRMTNRTGQVLSATFNKMTSSKPVQYVLAGLTTIGTLVASKMAHASVTYTTPITGLTGVENTTYTVYDIINSVLAVIYPAIIPIIVAGSTIFAAWWVWHRLRGAVS